MEYEAEKVVTWSDFNLDILDVTIKDLPKERSVLREALLKAFVDRKWLVLNFIPEDGDKMVSWVDKVHLYAAQNNFHLVKIVVFADYSLVETPLRSFWRGKFGNAGAIFKRFPDGIQDYLECAKQLNMNCLEQNSHSLVNS